MTYYLILILLLAVAEWAYIKLAPRYLPRALNRNHPLPRLGAGNHPDAFSITGGGFIFFPAMAAAIIPLIDSGQSAVAYIMMIVAALPLWCVSMADDLYDLRVSTRLLVQIAASMVALYYAIGAGIAVFVGGVMIMVLLMNTYNFLDGISGMLVLYSIVTVGSLVVALTMVPDLASFVPAAMSLLIAAILFAWVNVVNTDRAFAGDVGSVLMGFFVAWLLFAVIYVTEDVSWLSLVIVFVTDALLTIIWRIRLGENILISHKRHLYQRLVALRHLNHHHVALAYAGLQLVISAGYFYCPLYYRWNWFAGSAIVCIMLYFSLNVWLTKRTKSTDLS